MPIEQAGIKIVTLPRAGCTEFFANAVAHRGDTAPMMLQRLRQELAQHSAHALELTVFGMPACDPDSLLRDVLPGCQANWLFAESDVPLCAQAWAVAGARVEPVALRDRVIGTVFADGRARYVRLNGILPTATDAPRAAQARQVLYRMAAALRTRYLNFQTVARTWFFNRDILDWYDEFNATRNAFFANYQLDRNRLPASTGVGAHPGGAGALVGGLLAVAPVRPDVNLRIAAVASPRQGPAPAYGSAFSRAVEIVAPDHRRLLVSGTASIDQQGRTLHPGDINRQIVETLEIVERLLESCGMNWSAVLRGIAHFRRSADIPLLPHYLHQRNLPPMPFLPVVTTICREELLFELELEAAVVSEPAPSQGA